MVVAVIGVMALTILSLEAETKTAKQCFGASGNTKIVFRAVKGMSVRLKWWRRSANALIPRSLREEWSM